MFIQLLKIIVNYYLNLSGHIVIIQNSFFLGHVPHLS